MKKKILNDIVRIKRSKSFFIKSEKSAKIIPPSRPVHVVESVPEIKRVERDEEYLYPSSVSNHPKIKKRSRYMLWSVALFSLLAFIFAVSFWFGRATITVNPKIADVVLNHNFTATKDAGSQALSFDLVVIKGEESKKIETAEERDVSEKATGTVILYNAFSSTPQTLSINTKLEGSNGKIYITGSRIVIPPVVSDGTPGSIEIAVFAIAPGAEYNSGPLDFKIVGFKGTPKYAKFYGRSKGPLSGGYIGKAPKISDSDKTTAVGEIKKTLNEKLLKRAIGQIPENFILFKNAVFLDVDSAGETTVYNPDHSITMTEKGTLYGFLFNEQKLTKKIAESNITKYDGSEIYIKDIRDLNFTLTNKDSVSFADAGVINFNLAGPAKVIWKIDVIKFGRDMLGRSKKDFLHVLAGYPSIDSAVLKLRFPWMQSVPAKSKDIDIIVNYPS